MMNIYVTIDKYLVNEGFLKNLITKGAIKMRGYDNKEYICNAINTICKKGNIRLSGRAKFKRIYKEGLRDGKLKNASDVVNFLRTYAKEELGIKN